MAITYSTNLKLTLIGTGDQAGTWGNTTNTNLGTLIEQAIAGYVSQTVADSASSTSLSIADGTSSVARNMVLVLQGALSATRDIILPTSTKLYFIHNNTSGGFAVTAKCSGQTGVSIPNGAKVILACNGTDIVEAFNYSGSLIFPTSATITTLSGTTLGYGSASITNASIASGTVTNLRATTFQGGSASITNADIDSAVIGILTNTTFSGGSASITTANFASGTVTNLLATTFSGGSASITTASVASGTVTNLLATTFSGGSASITTVTGTTFGTTGASQIRGASGAIGQLTVTSATITNLNVTSLTTGNFPLPTSATIATLSGTTLGYASASITTASIASGTITNLLATTFSGGSASITTVTGTTFGTTGTTQLRGASAAITHLFATSATISTLTSTSASITNVSIGSGTVSGNFNLSGGTANGVAYLNGSKVLTTGSALTLNGSGNLSIGSTATSARVTTSYTAPASFANAATDFIQQWQTGTTNAIGIAISTGDLTSRFVVNNSYKFAWTNSASDLMTLSGAGNLGIGLIQLVNSGGTAYVGLDSSVGGLTSAYSLNMYHSGAYPITFSTSGTERMRIDSAGNLLVGTTTSPGSPNAQIVAGGTTDPGIQLASTSGGGGLMLGFASGGIGFYTYTGAVGSESYTDRMRLNSSGNLGIGTTSPSSRLEASGADCVVKSSATSGYAGFYAIGSGTNNSYLFLGNTTSGEQGLAQQSVCVLTALARCLSEQAQQHHLESL